MIAKVGAATGLLVWGARVTVSHSATLHTLCTQLPPPSIATNVRNARGFVLGTAVLTLVAARPNLLHAQHIGKIEQTGAPTETVCLLVRERDGRLKYIDASFKPRRQKLQYSCGGARYICVKFE